jgi:hypothetical protein
MNGYFVGAAALLFVVALVHTVLGEVLVFSRLRRGTLVPTDGGNALRERHVRILWATWHLVTAMGWAMAAMLLGLASSPSAPVEHAIAVCMLIGSALVLIGTNGRHPGWIGLLGVAILTWLGLA